MIRPRLPRWTTAVVLLALLTASETTGAEVRRTGDVIPDGTVRFAFGSSELDTRSQAILDRLSEFLKQRPQLVPVLLVGHADDRGPPGLNEELSRGRAEMVKTALIKRGIAGARIRTEGVGSTEPLSSDRTEAARARNRRVEVWVTPRGPVARVGRIQRRVQAREPAATDWRKARQNQALRRLSRVRTLENSSSEIRFPKDDLVTMGPNALAVIYGTPSETRRSRRATADVELQAGSLFAALAEREKRLIDVQARTGRVRVRSKRTRVNTDEAKKQSTVEVYDGESEVESAGAVVTVPRGYGTRVLDGQPPEPPRPLPAPPTWKETSPIFRFEGEPVEFGWVPANGVPAAEVQLGLGNDFKVERPVQLARIRGSTTAAPIVPGMYVARIAGVDDRGLVGVAGAPRPIIVMPKPTMVDGGRSVPRSTTSAALALPAPGKVRFYAPPASVLSILGQSSTVAVDIDLYASRPLIAAVKATDGGPTRYLPMTIDVPIHRVAATVGTPSRRDGVTSVPVDLRVTSPEGRGVDGLQFVAATVDAPSARLLAATSTGAVLAPCHCEVPQQASAADALGDGQYRWTLTTTSAATLPPTVRFYTSDGARAVETPLPASIAAEVAREESAPLTQRGPFFTLHGGTWLGTEEDPVFQVGLGAGYRFPVAERLAVDAWALARWFRRQDDGESLNVFPLTARVALSYTAFVPELYVGGGGGIRTGDVSTGGIGEVFAGVRIPLDVVDLDVEAGYTAAGSEDTIDELAGWGIRIGLRWQP